MNFVKNEFRPLTKLKINFVSFIFIYFISFIFRNGVFQWEKFENIYFSKNFYSVDCFRCFSVIFSTEWQRQAICSACCFNPQPFSLSFHFPIISFIHFAFVNLIYTLFLSLALSLPINGIASNRRAKNGYLFYIADFFFENYISIWI